MLTMRTVLKLAIHVLEQGVRALELIHSASGAEVFELMKMSCINGLNHRYNRGFYKRSNNVFRAIKTAPTVR